MSIQLRAFQQLPPDMPRKPLHTIVRTGEQFQTMMNRLSVAQAVTIDSETSGLAWYKHARACGLGLGTWDESGNIHCYYVPFRHQTGEQQLDFSVIAPAFKWLYEHPDKTKIGHNLKFEDHIGRREGWKLQGKRYDTQVAAHLFDENRLLALKSRAKEDLHIADADSWDSLLDREIVRLAKAQKMGKKEYRNRYGYSQVHIELCGFYGCHDIDFTTQLFFNYERHNVSSYYGRIWETEMALTEVLCDMEESGLRIDVAYLEQLRDVLGAFQAGIESRLMPMIGRDVNLGSDDELRGYLINDKKVGHLLWKLTDGGNKRRFHAESMGYTFRPEPSDFAVDAEVLSTIKIPEVQLWLEWKEAEKLRSTYTTSVLDRMDVNCFLHGGLKQNGTDTGRMSSAEPNLQNFPSDSDDRALEASGKKLKNGGVDPWSIRRAFIMRQRGWARLFFDYSQIELRVLAHYSRDPVMVAAYRNNEDIHLRTQMEVFGDKDPASKMRRVAKIINFGLSYCLTAQGLSRQAGIPLEEAEQFMARFNERYSGIDNFRKSFWTDVRRNGGYFNNLWGRTRRVPGILSQKGSDRRRGERQAIGSLIQGTAAELTKEALVRISRRFKKEGLPAELVMVIHDDIQADVPVEHFAQTARIMKEEMERFPEFGDIPILVDGQYTITHWADKHALTH